MSKEGYILLLDPALQDNNGTPSDNIGDVIIFEAIHSILTKLFPQSEIIRVSLHQDLKRKEKDLVKNARYAFVGGSNILTSDIRNFPRLTPVKTKGFYFYPGFKNVIYMGAGWCAYQKKIDWATRIYYRNIMHKNIYHSIRDDYSLHMLNEIGCRNTLFTSCPSTWELKTAYKNIFQHELNKVLLMFTYYYADRESDNEVIEIILETGTAEIFFFPQCREDTAYLKSLPSYKDNSAKFRIMSHSLEELHQLVSSVKLNYIGTRLHGGIKCMSLENPAAVIAVDNRATELGKSINLNAVKRKELKGLRKWVNGDLQPGPVVLPTENIKKWQDQFK
ncbi:MAG TPA: polysaccharide pyruvyl transferase family protein [Chitinophagaceae bacterium]|nr:polysaccharide pyruvyl transferase family protein [Chitinophagaceae bacterium]